MASQPTIKTLNDLASKASEETIKMSCFNVDNSPLTSTRLLELAEELLLFNVNPTRWRRVKLSSKMQQVVKNAIDILQRKRASLILISKFEDIHTEHQQVLKYLEGLIESKQRNRKYPAPEQHAKKLRQ